MSVSHVRAALACAILAACGTAHADTNAVWGQYHVVPSGQDVQYITLKPKIDANTCPSQGEQSTYALYLVDEYGNSANGGDGKLFRVPSNTVFLLTDVQMAGYSGLAITNPPLVPTLGIYANYSLPVFVGYQVRAYVMAQPLKGVKYETFQATRNFSTGVAFAANNYLCVSLDARSLQSSSPMAGLHLGDEISGTGSITATIQGMLITNYRQGQSVYEPMFNW